MAPWRSSFLAKGRRSDTARFHDHEAMSSDHEDFESSDVLLEKSVRSEIVRHRPYWRTIRLGNVMEYAVIVAIGLVNCLGLVLLFTGHIRIALVDTTALPPEMKAITPKVFSPSTPFTVSSEDKGFAAWKSLTNNIDIGSAYVPKNDLHGLFHSELNSTIPGYQMYPVSMYHQLHCLGTIREALYGLTTTEAELYGHHIGHCFDYLRQSLECNADLTLEYTAVGWEVEHLCKNPKDVQAFMDAYNGKT